MNSSLSNLMDSYRSHPDFCLEGDEFTLSGSSLEKFEDTYASLRNFASDLKKEDFNSLANACIQLAREIFLDLSRQASDQLAVAFWDELSRESLRVLEEEIECYRKASVRGTFGLNKSDELSSASRLKDRKYYFGHLDADVIAKINKIGQDNIDRFKGNAAKGLLKREDLSSNSGDSVKQIISVLNQEFDKSGVNASVSAYMGIPMCVVGLSHELSLPNAGWWKNKLGSVARPPKTLYAHLDESINYPKAIVYLSEVTSENGPTSCYPGMYENLNLGALQQIIGRVMSAIGIQENTPLKEFYNKAYHQALSSKGIRQHFMQIPSSIRFNSHLGWDILPDSNFENEMAAREVTLTGPAGTYIVFDGARLFHRGGLIQSGERLALQVVFGRKLSFMDKVKLKVKRIYRKCLAF